jgi:hypothetical protein
MSQKRRGIAVDQIQRIKNALFEIKVAQKTLRQDGNHMMADSVRDAVATIEDAVFIIHHEVDTFRKDEERGILVRYPCVRGTNIFAIREKNDSFFGNDEGFGGEKYVVPKLYEPGHTEKEYGPFGVGWFLDKEEAENAIRGDGGRMNGQEVICPYCGEIAEYVDSNVVYMSSYGMIYLCRKCKAWVGVHKGTDRPLGRLANAELRYWKKKAHDAFDPLWRERHFLSRHAAYGWLGDQLGLSREETHIGMFGVETCKVVVRLCIEERRKKA